MKRIGFLEVIAGPMYCGKTEELIRQVKRATIGKKHVQVFKHTIDTRYGTDKKVQTHDGKTFDSECITDASDIIPLIHPKTELIAIDEAQWFGDALVPVIEKLLTQGKHIIIAGLSLTFDRQPFKPMPTLMAMADSVIKLSAVCSICGADAVFHKRIVKNTHIDALSPDPTFVSALTDHEYEARCRNCYSKKP